MKLQHAAARLRRLREWLLPSGALEVPVTPAEVPERAAAAVCGFYRNQRAVLTTSSGLEIEIPKDCRVSVLEVANAIAWIGSLPEVEPRSERV